MKNKLSKILLSAGFAVAFAFILSIGIKADAQAAAVEQSAQTQNSVTVKWTPQENAQNYRIYTRSLDGSDYILKATLPASATSYQISGLSAGSGLYVKIKYDYKSSYTGSVYDYSVGFINVKTLPGKVNGLKQAKWYYFIKEFNAEWTKQSGVDGYEYIVKDSSDKVKAKNTITYNSNSFSVNKISNSMVYTAQVRAFSTINGRKYYGDWSAKAYFFTQPQIKKCKISGKKLVLKWSKVKGATGYNIYISSKPNSGYKKVKSVSAKKTSVTIKKFKKKKFSKKKKYYVYVATVKKVGSRKYNSGKLYYWDVKSGKMGWLN